LAKGKQKKKKKKDAQAVTSVPLATKLVVTYLWTANHILGIWTTINIFSLVIPRNVLNRKLLYGYNEK
jgi:hypothetical protein